MHFDSMKTEKRSALRPLGAAALVALTLASLAYWAGVPRSGLAAFVLGIAVLIGWVLLFGVLAWRLIARPAAPRPSAETGFGPSARRLMAVFLAISTLSLTVGGFWDEVWHRKFGLPFGEDLLWRPHLLIYFGLLVPPALAAVSLLQTLRRGRGSLRDRLGTDRRLILLWLLGGFLLFSVPADPVWHVIYGEDISAWSLPHLVLMLSALLVAALGAYLHLTTLPIRRGWSSLLAVPRATLFSAVYFLGGASIAAQVLIGDFSAGNPAAVARPAWLLPTLVTALAVLLGSLANHSVRAYGAATAVGILTLATRFLLIQVFAFPEIDAAAWLPLLPPLVALDIGFAWRSRRVHPAVSPLVVAATVLPGSALALWMIPRWYSYVHLGGLDVGVSLVTSLLAATAAAWVGGMIGDSLVGAGDAAEGSEERAVGPRWGALAILGAWTLLVTYLVATAAPPTHTF